MIPTTQAIAPAVALSEQLPPDVMVEAPETAPTPVIRAEELRSLGQNLDKLFLQYVSDRRVAELKWTRNLRQYLGIYDPDIENEMSKNRSRAYPRITRVKCISVLSRIMNLMFPGNERNWELKASPSPDMHPEDVMQAIQRASAKAQEMGLPEGISDDMIEAAVQALADERADKLALLLDDQLQELGGDQTLDYVSLARKVAQSGVLYGLGVLRGPFARPVQTTKWSLMNGAAMPQTVTNYKPQFEFLPIWDFYPDMSAKTFQQMDGYFIRLVMSRAQVRDLADRSDFFAQQIRDYLARTPVGNYKAQPFETELRGMGVKINVNEQKAETSKYEIIVWNGPVTAHYLQLAGVEVPEENLADDIDAEIWMIDGNVIKADMNPWRKIGADVRTIHTFLFDEDDTSPVGNGLPNVMRDSQMSVSAAARMLLDNASITCGPQIELNTDLLRPDQDLTAIQSQKIWYREGTGPDAAQPAVRNVQIDAHMDELLKTIELFMKFADMETFVGPATGGDMAKGVMPSEPLRTAAGASMLRGDAALPFKDIIRNFDIFTQSLINSLVKFNRLFNPTLAPEGDYNVIARGATSLIAKEVRGMQIDQLVQTLTPMEAAHVDERKLVEARFKVRDMGDLLIPLDEAKRRQAQQQQMQQEQAQQAKEAAAANIRKLLSDAFKNVAQGQKNAANADAAAVESMLKVLEAGVESDIAEDEQRAAGAGASGETGDGGRAAGGGPAAGFAGGMQGPAGPM